jgi:DNA uptake protein ComE-like DNA-binding protein
VRKTNHSSGAIRLRGLLITGLVLGIMLSGLPAWPGGPGGTAAMAAPGGNPPVDLNSASLEEVMTLPISEEVAHNIMHFRTYVRFYGNVYELMEVEGITPEIFQTLKPLVSVMPPPDQDASIARLSASYRQVRRYLGQEGSNEGLADEYLDKMRSPENINSMDLYDLMSYQNVSPVDATNILAARDRLGSFDSSRQLRQSDGLRYFAYRNLRDFVVYDDKDLVDENSNDITGYYQVRYHETPFSNDDDELGKFSAGMPRGRFAVGDYHLYKPALLNKMRFSSKEGIVGGIMTNREYGEQNWDETAKAFIGITDLRNENGGIKGMYFGSYRVAFGLGLVMDNTDYIHFRKTGYGFNKRLLGVHGDLSRSHEYSLTGAAVEGWLGPVNATLFVSSDKKDGILNEDGTINRYVNMQPRPDADWLIDREVANGRDLNVMIPSYLRRDAFTESLLGGNMKLMLAPGTFIGVTGYEARYDKAWRADVTTLVYEENLGLLEARDNEIWNSYNSVVENEDGTTTDYKWRRVMGAEAQAVFNNVSVQGEYAFLQDPRNNFFSSKNPDAYIVNAFSQWNNLHVLGIWRDYDVGFDNPYNRAFSNDNRYEQTILDAPYRLADDLYTWVESNTPQPKPEKGMFLEARYRISRKLILSGLQYDQWQRKSDGADLMRYTLKMEYQPKFNLRFRMRHRYSSRSEQNIDDVRVYKNWESRWQVIALLSNYNRLGFTYMTSNVMFPARPRFGGTPEAGEIGPSVGTAGMPAHAFEARYEHNITPNLKLTFASSVYDGFLWNFEGNEFVLLDGNGFRNWFKVESRVSERLLFQLKVTRDHNLPNTYMDVREFGSPLYSEPDATYVPLDETIVRLQMDYTF